LIKKPASIDPFSVEALEKSLNDSATRVSAIWVSFLIFGLYLVIAAGTVTHRQLLLADPVKLPVLNIDLPLAGFFFLAPTLFVVFHVYVLLQVVLLGRTAAAYNEALDGVVKSPPGNASMRQRLANTLFAQIFAGSPRERSGWLGVLLQMMAWLTLAIAPILVLLVLQLQFLPYHSDSVTWTHRILIALNLVAVVGLWPALRYADRNVSLRLIVGRWFPLSFAIVAVALAWIVLTFPGEPHAEWTRYGPGEKKTTDEVECQTVSPISKVFPKFDRLHLPYVDVVDHEKLRNIERNTKDSGQPPYEGERTRILRERDLNCGVFGFADLRRVDLTGTSLRGAFLAYAHLEGASLSEAQLQGALLDAAWLQGVDLRSARLQGAQLRRAWLQGAQPRSADLRGTDLSAAHLHGADFSGAWLQSADLSKAQLQGAELTFAHLQGADLSEAELQGAEFINAHLQGADLTKAQLQGAILSGAELQGASFSEARLQGAKLRGAWLQGADLSGAWLQGADLSGAWLQGADLKGSLLTDSNLSDARVWRARNAACDGARITIHNPDEIAKTATPEWIADFIDESVEGIINSRVKISATERMRVGLVVDLAKGDTPMIEEVWRKCEQLSAKMSLADFENKRAKFLRDLVCGAVESNAIAEGIIDDDRLINDRGFSGGESIAQVARGLLGEDGKPCPATKHLSEETKERLRRFVTRSEPSSAEARE
jgi:uncharacterized protein YjbI with pentapeptide repeats